MTTIKLPVDFQNTDEESMVRLNCFVTLEAIEALQVTLAPGIAVEIFDDELCIAGVLREPGKEGVWRCEIDWKRLRGML